MRRSRTMMLATLAVLASTLVTAAASAQANAEPVAYAAAVCDDHPNQASAQRARDTRDADSDGIYCVSTRGSGTLAA
ncbi:MAG: hypothetical protein ACRDPC_00995 [Solirubrobacteraceae bacterium]